MTDTKTPRQIHALIVHAACVAALELIRDYLEDPDDEDEEDEEYDEDGEYDEDEDEEEDVWREEQVAADRRRRPARQHTPSHLHNPHMASYYDHDVDFDVLAEHDPEFAAICKVSKDKKWVDFKDPKVVQQLTKSLLKCDFGLTLQLPDDRLCPPVPVRWNYIHWIQELLDTTSPKYSDRYDSDREVIGLDIGVGASCIYSLLACASRPKWRMAGTDIDQHSLEHARKNVEANGFDKRIKLALSTIDGPLLPLDALQVEELDFVMTNPPFYSSADDMMASYGGKTAAPSTVCTGSENELICPGGDFGFVSRIVDESLKLRGEVRWYTAMLGKLSSLQRIVARLKQEDITNFAVTTLQPGRQTKRWAVAWSFGAMRPRNDVSRHGELVHAVLPSPNAQTISCPLLSAQQAGERVHSLIKDLHVNWQWRSSSVTGVMEAKGNVWSRSARRKRKFNQVESGDMDDTSEAVKKDEPAAEEREDEEPVALAVKVSCGEEKIDVRWLRGHDYVLFESFCGLLKRTLAARGRG